VLLEVCLVIPLVYALRTTGEGVVLKRKLVASAMFSCRPM
jgi:glycopeptide antibiotics resistance protein